MEDYQLMVNKILEDLTKRELAKLTGNTERAVANWVNGAKPQNMVVRDKIKRLYVHHQRGRT